ncbi:MAG TPA: hypothetical protein VF023_10100 [Bryobacteraceae bacterium]
MNHRFHLVVALSLLVVVAILSLWYWNGRARSNGSEAAVANEIQLASVSKRAPDGSPTRIHAHNLLLRKGPDFRVYVRWLDGRLVPTRRGVNPSFDHPNSFNLDIQSGVIRANIGDIGHYLNTSLTDSPLKNVKLLANGPNLKLTGSVHKLIPLPVQVIASISATPDDRVRVHILKISVLKVPVKGILRLFHVSAADLVKNNIDGVKVEGNDLLLKTQTLLPPPHIRGHLTRISVDGPDIVADYGDARKDVERVQLWRNFFRLKGGTIDFGNLTMHPVDITMVDISTNPWFDLDLVNYREQFSSGYTRITDGSGLQMFIPDRRDVRTPPKAEDNSIQWFKDRNIPPPPQIIASAAH